MSKRVPDVFVPKNDVYDFITTHMGTHNDLLKAKYKLAMLCTALGISDSKHTGYNSLYLYDGKSVKYNHKTSVCMMTGAPTYDPVRLVLCPKNTDFFFGTFRNLEIALGTLEMLANDDLTNLSMYKEIYCYTVWLVHPIKSLLPADAIMKKTVINGVKALNKLKYHEMNTPNSNTPGVRVPAMYKVSGTICTLVEVDDDLVVDNKIDEHGTIAADDIVIESDLELSQDKEEEEEEDMSY